jgi:hypothetical protein
VATRSTSYPLYPYSSCPSLKFSPHTRPSRVKRTPPGRQASPFDGSSPVITLRSASDLSIDIRDELPTLTSVGRSNLELITPSNFPATPGLASFPASRCAMAPAHHGKKYAVASEKSSGTGNLNMRAGSLNPHLHQSTPQNSQQQAQMVNARNNSKNSARHAQQQQQKQPPHPNLAQAVAPARNPNSSPAGGTGAGSGQGHGPGDPNNKLHVSFPHEHSCHFAASTIVHRQNTRGLHPWLGRLKLFWLRVLPWASMCATVPTISPPWLQPWSMFRVVRPLPGLHLPAMILTRPGLISGPVWQSRNYD